MLPKCRNVLPIPTPVGLIAFFQNIYRISTIFIWQKSDYLEVIRRFRHSIFFFLLNWFSNVIYECYNDNISRELREPAWFMKKFHHVLSYWFTLPLFWFFHPFQRKNQPPPPCIDTMIKSKYRLSEKGSPIFLGSMCFGSVRIFVILNLLSSISGGRRQTYTSSGPRTTTLGKGATMSRSRTMRNSTSIGASMNRWNI